MDGLQTTGFGSPAENYAEQKLDWNAILFPKPHAMYAFRIAENGLSDFGILNRDIVIVDCSKKGEAGNLAAVVLDGEFRIGRLQSKSVLFSKGQNIALEGESRVIGVISRVIRLYSSL
jgi:DNA polymerase V